MPENQITIHNIWSLSVNRLRSFSFLRVSWNRHSYVLRPRYHGEGWNSFQRYDRRAVSFTSQHSTKLFQCPRNPSFYLLYRQNGSSLTNPTLSPTHHTYVANSCHWYGLYRRKSIITESDHWWDYCLRRNLSLYLHLCVWHRHHL